MKKAIFPGTFDPVTLGHTDIIGRALPLFDKLYIGLGRNSNKAPMFSEEQRLEWLTEIYRGEPKISVVAYDGLTVDCCKEIGASFIMRGIRYVNDFEYENAIFDPSDPAFMTREKKLSFNGFTINPGMKYHLSDLLFIEGSYKYFAVNSNDIDGTANTHFINLGLGFKF